MSDALTYTRTYILILDSLKSYNYQQHLVAMAAIGNYVKSMHSNERSKDASHCSEYEVSVYGKVIQVGTPFLFEMI